MSEKLMAAPGKRETMIERATTVVILQRITDEFSDEDKQNLREEYARKEKENQITGEYHRLITGVALNAVKCIMQHGGCDAEIHRALKYLIVCIDAKKYNLDYQKAYTDQMIGYLLEKYGAKKSKKE